MTTCKRARSMNRRSRPGKSYWFVRTPSMNKRSCANGSGSSVSTPLLTGWRLTSLRVSGRRSLTISERCWPHRGIPVISPPESRWLTCLQTQEVIVNIDLPLLEAVPEVASCEYLQTKKTLRHRALSASARNTLYQLFVAQMTLRTLRAILLADRVGLARTVACNGYVDTINTATGQPAHWCLVSVQVTRELFEGLDLARVKPLDCLAYLHAKISRTPETCQPVQPIIEYPWDDLPYSATRFHRRP